MDSLLRLLFVCTASHDCITKWWEQTMEHTVRGQNTEVLLDSLLSGFEIFVPAVQLRCQFSLRQGF